MYHLGHCAKAPDTPLLPPPPLLGAPQGISEFRVFKAEFPAQEFSTFQPFQTYYRKKTEWKERGGQEGGLGVVSRQVIYGQVWKLKRKEAFCTGWKGDKSLWNGSFPWPVAEYRLLLKAL